MNKKRLKSQFYKLALHELAHTRGARHCRRSSTCYMSSANGANPWDAEHDFCDYCKSYLTRQG